jgi:hypothetical protein
MSSYTLGFEEIDNKTSDEAGGKAANLGNQDGRNPGTAWILRLPAFKRIIRKGRLANGLINYRF